jgi:hypothetical protein
MANSGVYQNGGGAKIIDGAVTITKNNLPTGTSKEVQNPRPEGTQTGGFK